MLIFIVVMIRLLQQVLVFEIFFAEITPISPAISAEFGEKKIKKNSARNYRSAASILANLIF